MKKTSILILFLIVLPLVATAKHIHPEKYYQQIFCAEHDGQLEVVLKDGTRCDCVTDGYAVEVDFARKWAEGIGQALNYGIETGKPSGLLLIIETENDWKYYKTAMKIIRHYHLPITVWTIQP